MPRNLLDISFGKPNTPHKWVQGWDWDVLTVHLAALLCMVLIGLLSLLAIVASLLTETAYRCGSTFLPTAHNLF